MESFNLKLSLVFSFMFSMWIFYLIPSMDLLLDQFIAEFCILFIVPIQCLLVNDIAKIGGWRKENLFENII